MPKVIIDLNRPIGSKRIRAGFQPHWRTVFIYECPQCKNHIRIYANKFRGRFPIPEIGGVYCPNCELKRGPNANDTI
jgi:ssDNA-binding Zn-finger/Zn-ribbon topoisomerase 1